MWRPYQYGKADRPEQNNAGHLGYRRGAALPHGELEYLVEESHVVDVHGQSPLLH